MNLRHSPICGSDKRTDNAGIEQSPPATASTHDHLSLQILWSFDSTFAKPTEPLFVGSRVLAFATAEHVHSQLVPRSLALTDPFGLNWFTVNVGGVVCLDDSHTIAMQQHAINAIKILLGASGLRFSEHVGKPDHGQTIE